jgi:hypothetical protein
MVKWINSHRHHTCIYMGTGLFPFSSIVEWSKAPNSFNQSSPKHEFLFSLIISWGSSHVLSFAIHCTEMTCARVHLSTYGNIVKESSYPRMISARNNGVLPLQQDFTSSTLTKTKHSITRTINNESSKTLSIGASQMELLCFLTDFHHSAATIRWTTSPTLFDKFRMHLFQATDLDTFWTLAAKKAPHINGNITSNDNAVTHPITTRILKPMVLIHHLSYAATFIRLNPRRPTSLTSLLQLPCPHNVPNNTSTFQPRMVILPILFHLQPVLHISMLMISASILILMKPTPSNLNLNTTTNYFSHIFPRFKHSRKSNPFPFISSFPSLEKRQHAVFESVCIPTTSSNKSTTATRLQSSDHAGSFIGVPHT